MREQTIRMRDPNSFADLAIRKISDIKMSWAIVDDKTDEEVEKELTEGLAPYDAPVDLISFDEFKTGLESPDYESKVEAYVTQEANQVVRGYAKGKSGNLSYFHIESEYPLTERNLQTTKNMLRYCIEKEEE